jgi:NADP-dependent 3-hydroxy acid dehydrogenase YdfG
MSSLAHKTVVILGGTSDIGLATAKAAQAEGARVIATGRSHDRLQAAQSERGSGARSVALDVADEGGTRALFQELDRVDHIFITAGSLALDARLTPDSASLRPAMDIRFWGAFNAAKYGGAKMNAGGSITFMSGTTARRPLRGAAVATASCGAVEAFARSLAIDSRRFASTHCSPDTLTRRCARSCWAKRVGRSRRRRVRACRQAHRPSRRARRRGAVPDEERLRQRHHADRRWGWIADLAVTVIGQHHYERHGRWR